MAKQSGFMKSMAVEMNRRENEARHLARVYQMDMVTIALGRLGWGEKRFQRFDELLTEVVKEYGENFLNDLKDDKDLWKSKADLDREPARYVGKRFVPFEERYK